MLATASGKVRNKLGARLVGPSHPVSSCHATVASTEGAPGAEPRVPSHSTQAPKLSSSGLRNVRLPGLLHLLGLAQSRNPVVLVLEAGQSRNTENIFNVTSL